MTQTQVRVQTALSSPLHHIVKCARDGLFTSVSRKRMCVGVRQMRETQTQGRASLGQHLEQKPEFCFISFPLDIDWATPMCQVMLWMEGSLDGRMNQIYFQPQEAHIQWAKRKAQNNRVLTHTQEIILFTQRTAKLFCSHLLWQNNWRFSDLTGSSEASGYYTLVVEVRTELSADLSSSCHSETFTMTLGKSQPQYPHLWTKGLWYMT